MNVHWKIFVCVLPLQIPIVVFEELKICIFCLAVKPALVDIHPKTHLVSVTNQV